MGKKLSTILSSLLQENWYSAIGIYLLYIETTQNWILKSIYFHFAIHKTCFDFASYDGKYLDKF